MMGRREKKDGEILKVGVGKERKKRVFFVKGFERHVKRGS